VARERFARRGQFASLEAAPRRALQAAPDGAVVRDRQRYDNFLDGRPVVPDETAAFLFASGHPGHRGRGGPPRGTEVALPKCGKWPGRHPKARKKTRVINCPPEGMTSHLFSGAQLHFFLQKTI
jgi:hypothetical protein